MIRTRHSGVIIDNISPVKRLLVLTIIIGSICVGGYIIARHYLKPGQMRTDRPAAGSVADDSAKKAASVLDLRPRIIEKLQDIVSTGSNGIYGLSIQEIEPDVLNSTLAVRKFRLMPDSARLAALRGSKVNAPDLFELTADSIDVSGIGIKDLLQSNNIDIKRVFINSPTIDVYSSGGSKKDSLTINQRLKGLIEHFSAGEIEIRNGTIVNHNLRTGKQTKFKSLDIVMKDILIDSTTATDASRFLFAKQAFISSKNFAQQSKDGLYNMSVGSVRIDAANHVVNLKNFAFIPRYNKKEFGEVTKTNKERYELTINSIELADTDWWSLINNEKIVASKLTLDGGSFDVYFNRALPSGSSKMGNFPHQLLQKLPVQMNIRTVSLASVKFSYEEFNPASGKAGRIFITGINGTVSNLTNIASVIRSRPETTIGASGFFLGKISTRLNFRLDLAQVKTGKFSSTLVMSGLKIPGEMLNSFGEPIGLFSIRNGTISGLRSEVSGDEYQASGKTTFLYEDLKVAALEKDAGKKGGLDKKDFTSFVANTFLVKKNNPGGSGAPRVENGSYKRNPTGSFFNLIWKTTFTGILKTVGLPTRLADAQ